MTDSETLLLPYAALGAIRTEAIVSLGLGIALIVGAVLLLKYAQKSLGSAIKESQAEFGQEPDQMKVVRRLVRAVITYILVIVMVVAGGYNLFNPRAWLGAIHPRSIWLLSHSADGQLGPRT
jgi:arginine exporter protein ArgO